MNMKTINKTAETNSREFTATRNSCRLCAPLGASLAFRGIEGCVPLIHGSQGCSTYIRRYIISHFREPMDIASSNFTEASAVFGGRDNLHNALNNVIRQYKPKAVGIASTCLSETIGDDVDMYLREYTGKNENPPPIIYASTPSYSGSHLDGYFKAISETVKSIAGKKSKADLNIIPGFVSAEDIRYIREITEDMEIRAVIFPDFSETLDGEAWDEYISLSPGGTPVDDIESMGSAAATIQVGGMYSGETAAGILRTRFGTADMSMDLPVGIDATDKFFRRIREATGKDMPEKYSKERGRLADSYIDGHKYVFGKRAIIGGDEDMVTALSGFCLETGIQPVLCATGTGSSRFEENIGRMFSGMKEQPLIFKDTDYTDMLEAARELNPDLVISPSKGYYLSGKLNIPIVRAGFPVHDRIGGQRILHLGYRGAQRLFDNIVNSLLEYAQEKSGRGYSYQ